MNELTDDRDSAWVGPTVDEWQQFNYEARFDDTDLRIEMSWKVAADCIAMLLQDGSAKGKQTALEELRRMAAAADRAVAAEKALREVKS